MISNFDLPCGSRYAWQGLKYTSNVMEKPICVIEMVTGGPNKSMPIAENSFFSDQNSLPHNSNAICSKSPDDGNADRKK